MPEHFGMIAEITLLKNLIYVLQQQIQTLTCQLQVLSHNFMVSAQVTFVSTQLLFAFTTSSAVLSCDDEHFFKNFDHHWYSFSAKTSPLSKQTHTTVTPLTAFEFIFNKKPQQTKYSSKMPFLMTLCIA